MSQPSNLVNGPTNEYLKEEILSRDMSKVQQQNDNVSTPSTPTSAHPQRPLTRIDSRSNFQFRPPFPNQSGGVARPGTQSSRQPGPNNLQFVPRSSAPTGAQRPQQSQPPVLPFPPNQQRPAFRPASPFPRPGISNQRLLFQQRSGPTYGVGSRSSFPEEAIVGGQTLDSSELDTSITSDDNKNTTNDYTKSPTIAGFNKSSPLSSNLDQNLEIKEETKRAVHSSDSFEEGKVKFNTRQGSISGSSDTSDRKPENDIPPRPESRSASRMSKRAEDEERSPSSLTDVSQKSPDLSNVSDSISKSQPTVNKTPDSNNSTRAIGSKTNEEGKKAGSPKQADLNKPVKSSSKSEGDDSGVDESTQERDQSSNGDSRSRKVKSARISSATPTRSLSRGSKSPSLKSPDSNATFSAPKKVPMNKIQVGAAPSPNLKSVSSKIGSLENANYKPGGGKVKIESKKLDFKVGPRIEDKNDKYSPRGGDKKIVQQKLVWSAKSKVGSLDNASHKPKGGHKKIESVKLDFKGKAKPKVGSKDNIKYQPGGGEVKIETKKIELNVTSKIGSLDNIKHKPGGGDKKIFNDKEYLKQKSTTSSINHSLSGSQNSLPSQPETKQPVADENLNQEN